MSAFLGQGSEVPRVSPGVCPDCPLASRMRVGGRGNPQAPLVILGEAPGGQELHKGIPFCGPSGQLLAQSLPIEFDLDAQAFICNAIQCCPPKTSSQTRDKALKERCVAACRQGVQDLLWKHPRKCVLVLGNWAAVHLFGDSSFKITRRRGEVDQLIDPIRGDIVDVVYAMHPASLLHGRGTLKAFCEDLRLGIECAYGSKSMYGEGIRSMREQYVDPTFEVLETSDQVLALAERIAQEPDCEVAADTETGDLSPYVDGIICLGIYGSWDDNQAQVIPWRNLEDPEYAKAVNTLLEAPTRWIWQNGKFDIRFLQLDPYIGSVPVVDDDTLLLSYALDEASKAHDLEEQAKNLLGAPNYKDALKPWLPNKKSSYRLVPERVLFDYLAKDVKNTWHIKQITRAMVAEDVHLDKLYTRTLLPAQAFLTRVELYGICTDPVYVEENFVGLQADLDVMAAELGAIAGRPINPNSWQEVGAYLYDELGLKLKGKRPPDTRKETLDKLPPHPAVKLIRKYRGTLKMLSTYVEAIRVLGVDDIIHTTFKLHATTTGRPSSSEPNILNIPRLARLRRMYCARPGHILLEADYNTAELRGLAVLSGDETLMEIFLDGKRNLHDEVSVEMYGPNFTPDQRIRAKAINFGIPYGRTAHSVADEHDISTAEAQRLIDRWFTTFPGAHKFIMKCRTAPTQGRTLITPFGRKRRPGLVTKERLQGLQNEFANFFMQSIFSNDNTMHAAMAMEEELLALGAHIVNIPYDSIVLEVPDEPKTVKECARILKWHMEEEPKKWINTPIQFVVDMKYGTHWGLLKNPPGGYLDEERFK